MQADGSLSKSSSNGKDMKGKGRMPRMRDSFHGARETMAGSASVLEGLKGAVRDVRRGMGGAGDGDDERLGWVGGVREVWVDGPLSADADRRRSGEIGGQKAKHGYGLLTKGCETGIWKVSISSSPYSRKRNY